MMNARFDPKFSTIRDHGENRRMSRRFFLGKATEASIEHGRTQDPIL
jgi:hypothetical protein